MKAIAIFLSLIGVMITLPIWFYLLYSILDMVNATPIMWFLYWVYVPAAIIVQFAAKIVVGIDK